jgi:hypothetical protein
VSNYTQIARKAVILSDTYTEGVDVVGQNPMGRAIMKSMKEYKRDVEFDLLGRQGSSAGATNTAAASGGVCAWIFGTGADASGQHALSVDGWYRWQHDGDHAFVCLGCGHRANGRHDLDLDGRSERHHAGSARRVDGRRRTDVILASASQKVYIDALTSLATRTADIGKSDFLTIQGSANLIVTSFGTFKVVLSRYLNRTTTLLLDMDKWAMGQLRAPKVKDMAKTGDATKKLIVGEYTLIARNPNSSAKLQGFKE